MHRIADVLDQFLTSLAQLIEPVVPESVAGMERHDGQQGRPSETGRGTPAVRSLSCAMGWDWGDVPGTVHTEEVTGSIPVSPTSRRNPLTSKVRGFLHFQGTASGPVHALRS
jgi:hypothetical protein